MEPIRLALVAGEMYSPLYAQLEQWASTHDHRIEIATRLPFPELMAHLRLTREHGDVYSLVSCHSQYTASMAERFLPLDDLIPADELADFAGPSLEMCRWQGRLYQLPRSVETRLLYYRTDVFEDSREQQYFREATDGRELRVPQTWEELAAVAQYFTRAGKMYGWAFPGRHAGLVATFAEILTSMGGAFFTPEGRPGFYTRAGEWSLKLLRDLYGKWSAVPPETPEMDYEDVSEMFRGGRCAMVCDFPGIGSLLRDPSFSAVAGWHSAALIPAGTQGRRSAWTGCPTFAIPADCPNPENAVQVLLYLTGIEAQGFEASKGAIPSRRTAFQAAKEDLREGTLGHLRFTLAEQTLRIARLTPPAFPEYQQMEERIWPFLQSGFLGEREPAEALELAFRAAEEALSGLDQVETENDSVAAAGQE
jgi:multiple sugar transport system substrate-binding protein